MTTALDSALNTTWAMEEGALTSLLNIAARQNSVTPEALEAYRAENLKTAERAKLRDGVAVIDIIGALFPRANLMTAMSGATSYDLLRRDFQAAIDDPNVKAILLNVDSPGGSANGTGELSEAIFAARGKKPIVAYVGGMGASAGYWIPSAADKIIVDPTALLGSIGVQWAITDSSKAQEKKGVKTFKFISSQSPMKNADPSTEAGAAAMQATVDAMAQVFVETVARNRGVDTETALNNFGKGGIFVGEDAVKAGLADALGSFESVLAELAGHSKSERKSLQRSGGTQTTMSDETHKPEATAAAVPASPVAAAPTVDVAAVAAEATQKAMTAERTRIAGLSKIATAHGVSDAVLQAAINDGSEISAFSLAVADLANEGKANRLAELAADDTTAAVVEPSGAAAVEGGVTAESLAAQIAAFAPGAKAEK